MNRNALKPNRNAFSLIEVLIVLSMSAVIIITALNIHSQVRKAAAAVDRKIENDMLPINILQRIAEDIDRLSTPGAETSIVINNKIQDEMHKSQMIINSFYYDKNNKKKIYEQVIWRAHYDAFEERTELLRSHGGIALEDSLLDVIGTDKTDTSPAIPSQAELQEEGDEPFIFICSDFSLFEFSVPQGEEKDPLFKWSSSKMPPAVTATISFAEPIEDVFGDYIIPPEKIYTRTIATDRVKKMIFQFVRQDFDPNELDDEMEDPNGIDTDMEADKDEKEINKILSDIEKPNDG
jgi:hypothetical protein